MHAASRNLSELESTPGNRKRNIWISTSRLLFQRLNMCHSPCEARVKQSGSRRSGSWLCDGRWSESVLSMIWTRSEGVGAACQRCGPETGLYEANKEHSWAKTWWTFGCDVAQRKHSSVCSPLRSTRVRSAQLAAGRRSLTHCHGSGSGPTCTEVQGERRKTNTKSQFQEWISSCRSKETFLFLSSSVRLLDSCCIFYVRFSALIFI